MPVSFKTFSGSETSEAHGPETAAIRISLSSRGKEEPTGTDLDSTIDSSVTVQYHGATVTDYTINGKRILFTSEKAVLDGSKAIRGGIPLVFPQFGPAALPGHEALPQHGFARLSRWSFQGVLEDSAQKVIIAFSLDQTQIPKGQAALWPYTFKLTYKVTLTPASLTLTLDILNTSEKTSFPFTTLLHTYFRVPDVTDSKSFKIKGLESLPFTEFKTLYTPSTSTFISKIGGEVDRVYANLPSNNLLISPTTHLIKSPTFQDVVVWNPWDSNAKKMSDFGDEEFKEMVCVEVGSVSKPNYLNGGEGWSGSQTILPF